MTIWFDMGSEELYNITVYALHLNVFLLTPILAIYYTNK